MKLTDIAWLAGLLEGEGCFHLDKKIYPLIVLQMTDEDVVTRAAFMMKVKINRSRNLYSARTFGVHAIMWMMTLYPFLGKRRREKVTSIIKFWRECKYTQAPNNVRLMATCHPDRLAYGSNQLCKVCHVREYKARKYREKGLPRRTRSMATCHPDRVMNAFGLCHACYAKKRRNKLLLEKAG